MTWTLEETYEAYRRRNSKLDRKEDQTQECMLGYWEALRRGKPVGQAFFAGLRNRIDAWQMWTKLRNKYVPGPSFELQSYDGATEDKPVEEKIKTERQLEVIRRLSDKDRLFVAQFFAADGNLAEVARMRKIEKSATNRAWHKLQAKIRRLGGDAIQKERKDEPEPRIKTAVQHYESFESTKGTN